MADYIMYMTMPRFTSAINPSGIIDVCYLIVVVLLILTLLFSALWHGERNTIYRGSISPTLE